MSLLKYTAAGLALGTGMFFALATMLSQSSGAKIFIYQGF
jgi:hypothetical protein